jgi:hypothetical protein
MGKFSDAFDNFKKDGSLSLGNGHITLDELIELYRYTKDNQSSIKDLNCNFSLNDIVVDHEKFTPPTEMPRPMVDAPSKATIEVVMQSISAGKSSQDVFEGLLGELLANTVPWKTIELDNISFHRQRISDSIKLLNDTFISLLTKRLQFNPVLEQLSLLHTAINAQLTAELIKASSSLKILHLLPTHPEIYHSDIWAAFKSTNPFNETFLELITTALYAHPSIEQLALIGPMSRVHYQKLNTLLDNNYKIELLLIPEPEDENLNELHYQLLSRLSQNSYTRFIKERLNQKALYDLALYSIIHNKPDALNIILEAPSVSLDMSAIKRCLPAVYAAYPRFMEHAWQENSLDLLTVLPEHKEPIGIRLLNEAFDRGNLNNIETMLNYSARRFNKSSQLNHFLAKKLFEKTDYHRWKTHVLVYFQQDLFLFSPWINKLAQYPDIQTGLYALHKHLGQYLAQLLELHHQSNFKKMLRQSHSLSAARKQEWEDQFHDLIEGLRSAEKIENTKDINPNELRRQSFIELCIYIEKIVARAGKAELGYRNRSCLHEETIVIGKKLLMDIKSSYAGLEKDGQTYEELKEQLVQEKKTSEEMASRIKQLESILSKQRENNSVNKNQLSESENEEQHASASRFFKPKF